MSDPSTRSYPRHLRLPGYDYRQAGAYFITICTHHRACLFGLIDHHTMLLNDAGITVHQALIDLPDRFPTLAVDALVVMPNHLHAIIVLSHDADTGTERPGLGAIVGAYTSLTTRAYAAGVRKHGWPPYDAKLWQPNYYEHVIRDEGSLNRVRAYIENNPVQWEMDEENPDRVGNGS